MTEQRNTIIVIFIILALIAAGGWMFFGSTGHQGPALDPDKVAVASSGPDMNSRISEFFGRAPYYVVYDLKRKVFWTVENPYVNEKHAVGLRAGAMLKAKGVGAVIGNNIGPEPVKKFNDFGIRVYIGASGTVAESIRQYRTNQLILTTKPNVPTHYGLPGQKPCPNVLGQPKTRVENPMAAVPDAGTQVQQVALPVTPQGNRQSVLCPYCNTIITLQAQWPGTEENIICPHCLNRISPEQHNQPVTFNR